MNLTSWDSPCSDADRPECVVVRSSVFAPEIGVVGEMGTYAVTSSVEAARHGAGRDSEHGGGFVVGEAVDVEALDPVTHQ
jgi:hypothetical protein